MKNILMLFGVSETMWRLVRFFEANLPASPAHTTPIDARAGRTQKPTLRSSNDRYEQENKRTRQKH